MKNPFNDIVLWTDSTIVLAWIKKDPSVLKPFVKNRVTVIQHLTEVNTKAKNQVMADLPSDRVMVSRVFTKVGIDHAASESIVWNNNQPATPHFGGLWEAVEAVLNSRLFSKTSSNPNDFILTPAHFLVGTSLTCLPEPNLTNTPINRLNSWQLVQKLTQTFWKNGQMAILTGYNQE
ncbi:DUF5641 domain-containing protein [Trichonephila clavipes]|nr:DUF5641 domain-containing protein [Trichonephila clavipes]